MRFHLRYLNKASLAAFLSVLALAAYATAGSLTPSASPASTMHTLEEIWDSIASNSYDSSAITSDQNGSLIANLKYINSQLGWASVSGDLYYLGTGNVGIGDPTPDVKFEVVGGASFSELYGIGLSDCDVAGTSKLLWDATSGTFSCGTDQSTAGSGVTSNSLDFDEFVDAMTLDATTSISLATYDLIVNLPSSGNLVVKDNGTTFARFASSGRTEFGSVWEGGPFLPSLTSAKPLLTVSRLAGATASGQYPAVFQHVSTGTNSSLGLFSSALTSTTNTNDVSGLTGLSGYALHNGTGSVTSRATGVFGLAADANVTGGGGISQAIGVYGTVWLTNSADSTTTWMMGVVGENLAQSGRASASIALYAKQPQIAQATAFIDTNIGMLVDNIFDGVNSNINILVASSSNEGVTTAPAIQPPAGDWSIYNASTRNNYFAGNLGIGTKTPATTLEVAGTASISGLTLINNSASVSGNFELGGTVSSNWIPTIDNTFSLGTSALRWSNLFATNASVSSTLEANIASVSSLYVNGSAYATVGWTDTGSNVYVTTTTDNVGIGTSSPITQFQVAGRVPAAAAAAVSVSSSPAGVYIQDNYAYVTAFGSNTLKIIDISNPASPSTISSVGTSAGPWGVSVQGAYAYVVTFTGDTLETFDISNPKAPVLVDSIVTGLDPYGVYVQGRYAYVTNYSSDTLQVFDVSNPSAAVSVGIVATGDAPRGLYVKDSYAYVATYGANVVQIFDVTNPTVPRSVGSVATGTNPMEIYVQGRYAYVTNTNSNTLQIIDVSNPAAPVSVSTVGTGAGPRGIYIQGRYAYVSNADGATLQVIDISNPASASTVGTVSTGTSPVNVSVRGRHVYVVNLGGSSMQSFDVGGSYIQQLEVGGLQTGTLALSNNLQVGNDAAIIGGLIVGRGAQFTGPISVTSSVSGYSLFTINEGGHASLSGNFDLTGRASISGGLFGSGLTDCDLDSQTLNWDAATGMFSCMTDGGGGSVSSNSLDFDEFVNAMTLDANTSIANNGYSFTIGSASVSSSFEATIASVSQLYIAGSAWGWPLEGPAGTISSPTYAFDGTGGMGIFRTSDTMVLQSKDSTPDLAGRSRLSLGEEFFSLAAVRTEDVDDSATWQCYDETGSVMLCRFTVIDSGTTSTTLFYPTYTSFDKGVSISANFELSGTVSSNLTPTVTNTYSLGTSALQWANLFTTNASAGGNLEVGGFASSSSVFGAGLTDCDLESQTLNWDATLGRFSCLADGGGGSVSSDSLDFDEFVDNMTLDANISIASAAFTFDFNNTQLTAGNIIPDMTGAVGTQSAFTLGDNTHWYSDIYVESVHMGNNSLYMNGTKILSVDGANILFSADGNQTIDVRSSGVGNMIVRSTGTGNVQLISSQTIIASASGGMTLNVPTTTPGSNLNITNQSLGGNILMTASGVGGQVIVTAGTILLNGAVTLTSAIVSGDLEANSASVSQLYIGGVLHTDGAGVSSDSLDFDEIVDSMTLDGNLTVASAGYATTWNGNFYHLQGNVGIGTTSAGTRLQITGTTTGSGATAIGALSVTATLSNSTVSGFQFGERHIFTVSGSTAGTEEGVLIRMIDNTALANTVRALEVQAFSGTNTAGVNTAIAAFGKTFGVQGTTDSTAAGDSVPAALFAYLDNQAAPTVGNAIRAYTDHATTATLVQFYHASTSFSGIGLQMNFGNSGGSFSGKYLDFQTGSTTNFTVLSSAATAIGTTVPAAGMMLDVQGRMQVNLTGTQATYAICHGTNGQTSDQELVDCSPTADADYMEMYPFEPEIQEGMIVVPSSTSFVRSTNRQQVPVLEAATRPYDGSIIGVMSVASEAGDFNSIGHNIPKEANPKPLALKGRVKVLVSLENGPIKIGDRITSSGVPGVGMRATQPGQVVGMALGSLESAASDSYGSVLMYVDVGYWAPSLDTMVADAETPIGDEESGLLATIIRGFKDIFKIEFAQGFISTFRGVFNEVQTDTVKLETGVTIKDQSTGSYYCLQMVDATLRTFIGPCGTTTPTPTVEPSSEPTPVFDGGGAVPTESPPAEIEEPSPMPEPSTIETIITPTPEPTPESIPEQTPEVTPEVTPEMIIEVPSPEVSTETAQ